MIPYIIVGISILGDILTGFLNALSKGEVDSTAIRSGLFHKVAEILAICFGYGVDFAMKYFDIGIGFDIGMVICVYILIMELVSIIENICAMNPQLNKLFSPYLNKLKSKNEQDSSEK